MNKPIFLTIIIFIFVAFIVLVLNSSKPFNGYRAINYQLNGKSYRLLVADTEEKRMRGLMNVTALKGYEGMIFLFPDKDYRTFWNKNTLINLTLYWIDDTYVAGLSELPSITQTKEIKTVYSPVQVNKVIELPSK